MKTCKSCQVEQSFDNFYPKGKYYYPHCKECHIANSKKRYEANREKISQQQKVRYQNTKDEKAKYNKEYREANIEQIQIQKAAYREANREKLKEKQRAFKEANPDYQKRYEQTNADKMRAKTAKRRALKLQATPLWLSTTQEQEIENVYRQSMQLECQTGVPYHVDHIVPLQGVNVCGLHVPWNLRVIPAKENLSKSNKLPV
jgi:hypothetical protein